MGNTPLSRIHTKVKLYVKLLLAGLRNSCMYCTALICWSTRWQHSKFYDYMKNYMKKKMENTIINKKQQKIKMRGGQKELDFALEFENIQSMHLKRVMTGCSRKRKTHIWRCLGMYYATCKLCTFSKSALLLWLFCTHTVSKNICMK